jgi:hypothetical protein
MMQMALGYLGLAIVILNVAARRAAPAASGNSSVQGY